MALAKVINIEENSAWALWHISESVEELKSELQLSEKDLADYGRISNERRKKEWLSCRQAMAHLAKHLNLGNYFIEKDEFGKPHLTNKKGYISLAHSFPYAVAYFHPKENIGIDIEQPKEKLLRVANKFLTKQERNHAQNDPEMLCIYWCAKEAIYKQHGMGKLHFSIDMVVEPFELKDFGTLNATLYNEPILLGYQRHPDLTLCFTIPKH